MNILYGLLRRYKIILYKKSSPTLSSEIWRFYAVFAAFQESRDQLFVTLPPLSPQFPSLQRFRDRILEFVFLICVYFGFLIDLLHMWTQY